MKRLSIFILIAIFATLELRALDPPCGDPCANSPWVYVTVPVPAPYQCSTCVITASYWYRMNNCELPPLAEIVMGMISVQGDCDACLMQFSFLWTYVYDYIIKNNPLVPVSGCRNVLKASTVICWTFYMDYSVNPPVGYYVNCDSQTCCWNKFKICVVDGVKTVTYLSSGGNLYSECEEQNGHSCTYICDLIYNHYNPPQKIGVIKEVGLGVSDIMVIPNPTDGKFSIQMNNLLNGDYSLIISDDIGNVVYDEAVNINSSELIKELNFKKFTSGTYFLKLSQGNNLIKSTNITITK